MLTLTNTNDCRILVNPAHVMLVEPHDRGAEIHMACRCNSSARSFVVSQTPEEFAEQLGATPGGFFWSVG